MQSNYESAILILGDSVGFGVGLRENKTVSGLLQANLPLTKVYNSSVVGYCTCDYKNVVENFLPSHEEIKVVYLFFCLNDLSTYSAIYFDKNANFFEKPIISIGKVFSNSKVNTFLRSHSKLYILIRAILVKPQYLFWKADYSLYADENKKNFLRMMQPIVDINEYLKERDIPFTVVVMPYEYQLRSKDKKVNIPQQRLSKFLKENGICYVDMMLEFKKTGIASNYLYLPYDPMHFSIKGHNIIFSIIMRDLKKYEIFF